jgi:hypothetical protein
MTEEPKMSSSNRPILEVNQNIINDSEFVNYESISLVSSINLKKSVNNGLISAISTPGNAFFKYADESIRASTSEGFKLNSGLLQSQTLSIVPLDKENFKKEEYTAGAEGGFATTKASKSSLLASTSSCSTS